VEPLSRDYVTSLYREYAPALRDARQAQRNLYALRGHARLERFRALHALGTALRSVGLPAHYRRLLRPKFDDIEAEITYLLLRAARPTAVVEIAPYYGWSTTWILQALRDNGSGRLYSYDLVDYALRTVPRGLANGRWTFCQGDVRRNLARLPAQIDYLFIDAAHTDDFARWYTEALFSRLASGAPVSVHDVFHSNSGRFSEGPVLLAWLEQRGIAYFTASPARAPDVYDALFAVKRALGLDAPIHESRKNPAVFFRLP
jgi:predicted O-methyltransferase YrrM